MDVVDKARIVAAKTCPECKAEFAAEDDSVVCPADHTPLETDSTNDPLIGVVIAERYEILELIGSGGWALIYKARQLPLNRLVAIKILHGHLAGDPEKKKRFKREAEAATKLVHENVGSVFDYGLLEEGQPYMVMEYLQGTTLQDLVRRETKLPVERCIDIFRQICAGLAMAHERNIVHRDIKPSNIYMIDDESQVKILDFGLAKLIAQEHADGNGTSLTQTGQTIGTPSYMSPEQCTGFPLDARSDLYSLGCVMFEVLTGRRAFEGRNLFETMSQQINTEAAFEGTDGENTIPADLQLVVMKALAKDPQERYQSAEDLDVALEQVLDGIKTHGGDAWQAKVRAFLHTRRRAGKRLAKEPLVSAVLGLAVLLACSAGWGLLIDHASLPSAHTLELNYRKSLASGQRCMDKRKFALAASLFGRAVEASRGFGEADQRHIDALNKQMEALRCAGDLEATATVEQQLAGINKKYSGAMYGNEAQNSRRIANFEREIKDKNPVNKTFVREICVLRNRQAELFLTTSRFEDAKHQLNRALELENSVVGVNTPEYATTMSNLAWIYVNTDDLLKAEQAYKEVLQLREKLLGPQDPFVAKSLRNLGDFYYVHGKYAEAEKLLSRSNAIYQKVGAQDDVAWTLNNLGLCYIQLKDYGRAQVSLEKALELRKAISKGSPDYVDVGRTIHNLGVLKMAQGNLREAVSRYEDALEIYETQLTPTHADTLACAQDLASAYIQQQDFKRAEPLIQRILSSNEASDSMRKQADESFAKIRQKLDQRT